MALVATKPYRPTTTFATLGLGNVGPGSSRLGMVLTSIEALLGALLIALAILVIGQVLIKVI